MRILIKGGVWKNTEDEILKAAVMKYGKNQWARVASLLNRKSAKQCKARWYEWLDPSIKKTEWTREEEEKLLHLAKLMPNQWRTIAPIVGRTAGQCMEHYERLLDQAQAQEEGEGVSSEDIRRLRPGEIDPTPETKPARPDPIDMDEDEKEMLSEARARLANTKGKKAKRKARERMLEQSRNLAMLQKRRELKAAGIESRLSAPGSRKRNFIDYAREIPFQKLAPVGFYDVSEENEEAKKLSLDPKKHGLEVAQLEGRHQRDEDERQRQRDRKLMKELFKDNAPLAVMKLAEQSDPAAVRRRLPLDLPAPQLTETEMEEIVRLSKSAITDMGPPEGLPSSFSATNALVSDYTQQARPTQSSSRASAVVHEDVVMQEARNLRALSKMTPLMMDANAPLPELSGGTGFDGVQPRRTVQATPNLLLQSTPGRFGADSSTVMGTDRSVMRGGTMSVLSTPGPSAVNDASVSSRLRDNFGLNQPRAPFASGFDDNYSVSEVSSIAEQSIKSRNAQRLQLLAQLQSLPEPEFTYEVAAPQLPHQDDDEEDDSKRRGTSAFREDATDREDRLRRQRELALEAELARRSTVLKRDLPRPVVVDEDSLRTKEEGPSRKKSRREVDPVQELIDEEMLHILAYEDRMFPGEDVHHNGSRQQRAIPQRFRKDLEQFEASEMDRARELINAELSSTSPSSSLDESIAKTAAAFAVLQSRAVYKDGRYVLQPSDKERLQALKTELQHLSAHFTKTQQVIESLEEKLAAQGAGDLTQRTTSLMQKVHGSQSALSRSIIDVESVTRVRAQEQQVAQHRLDRALEDALYAEKVEKECQERYAALVAFATSRGIAL